MASPYDIGLDKNPANFAPLTPLQFLEWSASVCPQRTALRYMDRCFTWAETYSRCRRLASALVQHGIGRGDTVAAVLWNTPEMFECQFGVPMSGAVLNTINVRLDPQAIAFMLDHGEAKVLITDCEFSPFVGQALSMCKTQPLVIDMDDQEYRGPGECLGKMDYEAFLATGDPAYLRSAPEDEWDAIALNYTSGTRAIQRASFIITAEPISPRLGPFLLAMSRATRSSFGRPRCFTATAGASPGQWRRLLALACVCAVSKLRPSSH